MTKAVRFTILDTETTGLNPQWGDNIIEVALLVAEFDGKTFQEITRFDSLVKPDIDITERVTYVTGIRSEDIENARRFSEIKDIVQGHLKNNIIVGHNVEFDMKFLQSSDIDITNLQRLDTMDLAGLFEEEGKSLSLESLAMRHAVSHDAHRAMGDVLATYEILQRYASRIATLDSSITDILSHILPRSDWAGQVLFPAKKNTGTLEQGLERFFAERRNATPPDPESDNETKEKEHASGTEDNALAKTIERLLDTAAQTIIHLPCLWTHVATVLDTCLTWSQTKGKPIRFVFTEFPDTSKHWLKDHPALRATPQEYELDTERAKMFCQSPLWDKNKILFLIRLLRWTEKSQANNTTRNTKELVIKHPERRYLYSILPIADREKTQENGKMSIISLREFSDTIDDKDKDETPALILDATFLDEEWIKAQTQTMTLHRIMNALQAVEEIVIHQEKTLFTDPTLLQAQEKAAFFFAHLSNTLSRLETKEMLMDEHARGDRKITESIALATGLRQHCDTLIKEHEDKICSALKKELRAIRVMLETFTVSPPNATVTLSLRNRDESAVQITQRDIAASLNRLVDTHPHLILLSSPARPTHILGTLAVTDMKEPERMSGTRVAIAQDVRPDQSVAYAQLLTEWLKSKLNEQREQTICIFGNAKTLETTVMALDPFLTEHKIPYLAERLGGGTMKVREFYEQHPRRMLFCMTEFFTSLQAKKIQANTFILQKLPFGMDSPVSPLVHPSQAFELVALPKSLVRFERILGQIGRVQEPEKELLILDNKILTEKSYGAKFRDMLPEGWKSNTLKNM